MHASTKILLLVVAGVLVVLCAGVTLRPRFDRVTKGPVEKGTDKYAAGSENAEIITDGIQQDLGELDKQMQSAGNGIAECIDELRGVITDVGELQNDGDRIAEAGRGIADTADRLERRILNCLQILGASEEDEELLEVGDSNFHDAVSK